MKYKYNPQGTCSKCIHFEIDDSGKLHNVSFEGGCHGNLQGIGRLVEGMDAADIAGKLRGVDCRGRGTSCPDQLSKALDAVLNGK